MSLILDTTSTTPPYEQLRDQLRLQIVGGTLPPGSRLPAIRQLAADLGIAPGTVARAYAELEQEALVLSRRAKGTVVADTSPNAGTALLSQLAATFARQAEQLGVSADEAVRAFRRAYQGP